ncbi:MAG: SspB family protein [Xanthobacteraceae bacterium]
MAVDHIRYDLLTQQALRGVVRAVLTDVAKRGLPGEHHFYISFDTNAEGLRLSSRMRAQYPQEMTIVLQHQFWDLIVTEEGFEVGLSFGGVPERLVVPFEAVKSFVDPSVEFGLRFEVVSEEGDDATKPAVGDDTVAKQPSATGADAARARPVDASAGARAVESRGEAKAEPQTEPERPSGGGEVVRLDRFRKK